MLFVSYYFVRAFVFNLTGLLHICYGFKFRVFRGFMFEPICGSLHVCVSHTFYLAPFLLFVLSYSVLLVFVFIII